MSIPRHRCSLSIVLDYQQFYVWDTRVAHQSLPNYWSDQDIANRAKAAHGVVIVCPVRSTIVPVEVEIWDFEPQVIFGAWQHVVEAPLETAGSIEIHECTGGSKACFSVDSGHYTVRILYRGLDTISEDGFEGRDSYLIQIWKSPCASLRVIRLWE
jgi:hypothetical protein